jgi:DNA-binding helix-hairpin-helix protein with protein kinase domain
LGRKEEAKGRLAANELKEVLAVWSDIIQQHSVPEVEWSFRLAVARSIRASGVCEYKASAHKLGTRALKSFFLKLYKMNYSF